MNDAIRILSENYVNEDCSISVVSGDATKAYLYDQNQDTKYLSSGSNDTITETITVVFKNWQGAEVSRTFDYIILLNTNFKAITAEYWDGAAWQTISEATLTLAAADKIIKTAASKTGSRIRMNVATTQTDNAEKYLGELKVCEEFLDLGLALTEWQPEGEQKAGAYRLAGGGLVSWKEWTKLSGSLLIENLQLATKDLLLPYIKAGTFITVVWSDTFDASDVTECAITGAPAVAIDRKAELFSLSLELRER